MKKLFISVIIFLMSNSAYPQSAFLDKNTSGFEVGASVYGQTDKSYLGTANFGYSFLGVFDAGFSLGPAKTYQDKVGLGKGLNYFALAPSFAAYVLKQSPHIPLSLSINASFESDAYYSDYLQQNDLSLDGNIYSIGANIYRKFALSQKVNLLTNVGASYRMERDVLDDEWGYLSSADNDYPRVNAGVDVIFKQRNNDLLHMGAGFSYDRSNSQNNYTVNVSLGVAIPWVHHAIRYYPRRYILVPADRVIEYPKSSFEPDAIIVNIPNSKGGYTPVRLVKSNGGYIGPQGEFYPQVPTVEQLKTLYGD